MNEATPIGRGRDLFTELSGYSPSTRVVVADQLKVLQDWLMDSTDVYRLLSRRMLRGWFIFRVLFLVLLGATGFAVVTGELSWALAGFLAALLSGFGLNHLGNKVVAAQSVSENPQLVYWAHPTFISHENRCLARSRLQFLLIHLRDGREFEVALMPDEMNSFVDWLTHENPSVRIELVSKPDSRDSHDSAINQPGMVEGEPWRAKDDSRGSSGI